MSMGYYYSFAPTAPLRVVDSIRHNHLFYRVTPREFLVNWATMAAPMVDNKLYFEDYTIWNSTVFWGISTVACPFNRSVFQSVTCICTRTHTYTHARTHIHLFARMRAHTQTHTNKHTHAGTHAHTHTRTHARTHAHTHAHTHTHTQTYTRIR